MSAAAGVAIGLAASAAANSSCGGGELTEGEQIAFASWVVGMVVTFLIGFTLQSIASMRGAWGWDLGESLIAGIWTLVAWAVGAPVVGLVWVSFEYLIGFGSAA